MHVWLSVTQKWLAKSKLKTNRIGCQWNELGFGLAHLNIKKPMKNIIFLDFDGPLVNHRVNFDQTYHDMFDPIAVRMIKRLCYENGANIVVTSSWRYDHSSSSIRAILNNAYPGTGEYMHPISPFTPRVNEQFSRGLEIEKWMKHQCHTGSYVIIDDSSDLLAHHFSHYVHCDVYDGLDYAGFLKAGHILRGEEIPDTVKELERPRIVIGDPL